MAYVLGRHHARVHTLGEGHGLGETWLLLWNSCRGQSGSDLLGDGSSWCKISNVLRWLLGGLHRHGGLRRVGHSRDTRHYPRLVAHLLDLARHLFASLVTHYLPSLA